MGTASLLLPAALASSSASGDSLANSLVGTAYITLEKSVSLVHFRNFLSAVYFFNPVSFIDSLNLPLWLNVSTERK